jgi:hypothetical protein
MVIRDVYGIHKMYAAHASYQRISRTVMKASNNLARYTQHCGRLDVSIRISTGPMSGPDVEGPQISLQ